MPDPAVRDVGAIATPGHRPEFDAEKRTTVPGPSAVARI